jgi:serine protease Do
MKNYSFRELLLTALMASVLTVVIAGFFPEIKLADLSIFDFFKNVPQATSTPSYIPVGNEAQVINTVKTNSPAVVAITISKYVPIIEQCPYNPFSNLPPEFQQFFGQNLQFYQPCQKGTKLQEVGGGSGFIISGDGVILTNKHVVADTAAEYTVFTNDGKKYPAKVLTRDSDIDIAVIKISASQLPTIKLGDSDLIEVGQSVVAIGNALGEFRNTVNVGVISGLSRDITASGGGVTEKIHNVIQTDASINPGNSGGPLLNLRGEVVGINTAIAQGAQSISFAIPINQVKEIISNILAGKP